MACEREGCPHVMCDNLINQSYICEYCLEEFKELYGDDKYTRKEFEGLFEDFLRTEKAGPLISMDDFLGKDYD